PQRLAVFTSTRRFTQRKAVLKAVRPVYEPLPHTAVTQHLNLLAIATDIALSDRSQVAAVTDPVRRASKVCVVINRQAPTFYADESIVARSCIWRVPDDVSR